MVERIVLIDWLIAEPPAPFGDALAALQHSQRWQTARDELFATWLRGVGRPELESFIYSNLGAYDFRM